jgi:hypothetical protein
MSVPSVGTVIVSSIGHPGVSLGLWVGFRGSLSLSLANVVTVDQGVVYAIWVDTVWVVGVGCGLGFNNLNFLQSWEHIMVCIGQARVGIWVSITIGKPSISFGVSLGLRGCLSLSLTLANAGQDC